MTGTYFVCYVEESKTPFTANSFLNKNVNINNWNLEESYSLIDAIKKQISQYDSDTIIIISIYKIS